MDKKKLNKDFPRLTIERYLTDEEGHITAIDLHDEKFGSAIFFQDGTEHRHGFRNDGVYKNN